MLRPLAIILRNILLKRHAYFSCCASCGDIRTPVEHRLCASLSPEFPVDVVLLPGGQGIGADAGLDASLAAVREYMPWVRRIWLPEEFLAKAHDKHGACALRITARADAGSRWWAGAEQGAFPEHLLHLADDLADHYIVIRQGGLIRRHLLCLDFFTPNGIPLLFADSPADQAGTEKHSSLLAAMEALGCSVEPSLIPLAGLYSQTRENAGDFAGVYEQLIAESGLELDYCQALAQWTYANAKAVPLARVHSARMRVHES